VTESNSQKSALSSWLAIQKITVLLLGLCYIADALIED